jgi:hypothetical protein
MKVVFMAIESFLARVAPRLLPSIATRIAALTSRAVNSTAPAIISAIRNFVGANIGKMSMVMTVLSGAGMVFDWDDLVSQDPRLAPYLNNFKAVTNQALIALTEETEQAKHQYTGNGREDDAIDAASDIIVGKAAAIQIRRATFATANLDNLVALREVMFMDESKFQKGLAIIRR